ncbi:MAG: hypothetical protein IJ766_08035 [Clostridia bacterium]|nr:hypothetical protein [Clostridia bacterium]
MKVSKIIAIVLAILLAAALGAIGRLYYIGRLSFIHPMQTATEGQIKVACVGDSVTYGFGIHNRTKNNYPAVLNKLLGDGYCVNNFGYSGRTVSPDGDRPYIEEALYQQSIEFQPDIIILMLGSNDSKPYNWDRETFPAHYENLLNRYQSLTSQPKIYIMLPPPAFAHNGEVKYDIQPEVIKNHIVPMTQLLADKYDLPCIDLYTLFEDKSALLSDGLHPDADGAKLIAQTVYEALTADEA